MADTSVADRVFVMDDSTGRIVDEAGTWHTAAGVADSLTRSTKRLHTVHPLGELVESRRHVVVLRGAA